MSDFKRLALLLFAVTAALAAAAEDRAADLPVPPVSTLSASELAVWNDPAFKKRFIESYLAETEVEPRVTIAEREQMEKVLAHIAEDRMDRAVKLLEKSRNEAASAVFDFTLANIYFQQEELAPAAAAYQVAVDKHPKFRRAWRNLALIHVRQGEHEKALAAFRRVVELGGGDALTYGLLGYCYSLGEKNLPAESAYRLAILLDPDTMDWQMGLARSLFKQERYADAAALCAQLLAGNPERSDLWLLQANAYIGLNRPLEAAANYEIVDRLGRATVASLNMTGDIYVNEALYDLAVDAYLRALEMAGGANVQRPLRAARVLVARGAFDETAKLLRRTREICAGQLAEDAEKEMLKLQARLAVAAGEDGDEVAILERIVALDPLDGEALILLGQHSARTGDEAKAVFYYERAAGLDEHEADAKVRHAQLLVGQGKYREGIALLKQAQDVKPREHVQKYLEQVERVAKSR